MSTSTNTVTSEPTPQEIEQWLLQSTEPDVNLANYIEKLDGKSKVKFHKFGYSATQHFAADKGENIKLPPVI